MRRYDGKRKAVSDFVTVRVSMDIVHCEQTHAQL